MFSVNFVFPRLIWWLVFPCFFSASPFSWHLKKEGLFLYVKFSFPPQEMAWKHQKRHAIQLKKRWFWKGMMWILLWIAGEMECHQRVCEHMRTMDFINFGVQDCNAKSASSRGTYHRIALFSDVESHWIPSLKLTASLHLKVVGWKTTSLLGRPVFKGYVSFREGYFISDVMLFLNKKLHWFSGTWDFFKPRWGQGKGKVISPGCQAGSRAKRIHKRLQYEFPSVRCRNLHESY